MQPSILKQGRTSTVGGFDRVCESQETHCTAHGTHSVHGRVSTRCTKIDTDLGDVVHRQHSPTCPYTVLCDVSGGSLDNAADKLKTFKA